MLKAILIISVTVILVFFGAYGAMVVYIFEEEERYEHEKKSDASNPLQEELQRDNT